MAQISLGDIRASITQKNIKNLHLSVYPPLGRVQISAPLRMNLETIRIFAIGKLGWIKRQQAKFKAQERESPRDFINRESHYLFGKRYLMKVIERNAAPEVIVNHDALEFYVRPTMSKRKRKDIFEEWCRSQLKAAVPQYVSKWEKELGVKVKEIGIKKMRTRWGTCNPEAQRVWLNWELVRKPENCLEYIILHEMLHLLERRHNFRFVAYMNKHLPTWRSCRDELNRLPIRHTNWSY